MGPCEDEDEDEDKDEDSSAALFNFHHVKAMIVPLTVPYKRVILYVLSRMAEA